MVVAVIPDQREAVSDLRRVADDAHRPRAEAVVVFVDERRVADVSIVDRVGLEAMACECHAIVCRVYEQALLN